MDYDIEKAKELIEQREEIDRQLAAIFNGSTASAVKTRAPQKCSRCNKEGHSARTCPEKETPIPAPSL
ncbi:MULTISPECIES: C2HC-type zinc finger protein [Bradyrhizobium]|uniref:C2HC-type zinc finger protein n=1 Tax=Bradyrhizobium TaxID=374 RepID=UPI001EDBE84F|nr:C2HC-type zinc finger protein [Bradyrhizobium zhengyangense]MCG2645815.1 zinc finger domain-containing protein [Bradyrhizobium zhengyangense]